MTVCNVLDTLTIGNDTAIVVDSSRELFRNGTGILDENGKPFEVLSVGLDDIIDMDADSEKASLLLSGKFSSHKIFV